MLTITIQVNAPSGQAIGIKEDIAAYLEKFGDARVVSIVEKLPEQLRMDSPPQRGAGPAERTRQAVYATGNRWAIENFEATHSWKGHTDEGCTVIPLREMRRLSYPI